MPALRIGSKDKMVVVFKDAMANQGFWTGNRSEAYTKTFAQAVAYFQQTHLGPDGEQLQVDGIIGPNTMWALTNPTGKPQKSNLSPKTTGGHLRIPKGISEERARILGIALGEHNVREKPNGSNRGPGVDKYLPRWAQTEPGPPWCCFFVSWVTKQALGQYPLGRNHGSCARAWKAAQEREMVERSLMFVAPGDVFYMRFGPTKGHVGFVYRVSEDGTVINTVEGNCGNRVKIGRRVLDARIHGVINFFEGRVRDFDRGLIDAKNVGKDGTR